MNHLFKRLKAHDDAEQGQIILLLAFAMIGLLVAMGLAIDAGFLYARKTQLDRAIESAALAGAVRLYDGDVQTSSPGAQLTAANIRGMQLLAANRVITGSETDCGTVDWDLNDYCGEVSPGSSPGSVRYHAEARWNVPTFFMGVLGFGEIPLQSASTAEYMPLVDLFASELSEYGYVKTSNQSIFGPSICTSYGDAYTPRTFVGGTPYQPNPWYDELGGVYTYRIRIPSDYTTKGYTNVRVEIFDPDTGNQPISNKPYNGTFYRLNGTTGSYTYSDRNGPLVITTGESQLGNPYWFAGVDENRGVGANYGDGTCGGDTTLVDKYNTLTLFRLYYLQAQSDGSLQEVDLAYYIGKAAGIDATEHEWDGMDSLTEAVDTDMMWVSPGSYDEGKQMHQFTLGEILPDYYPSGHPHANDVVSPVEPNADTPVCETFRAAHPDWTDALECTGNGNFIVDLTGAGTEVPNIHIDQNTGTMELFLQVRGLRGASENGFQFWAGPADPLPSEDPNAYIVPADVNMRHLYIMTQLTKDNETHNSRGVTSFGVGHLPMNADASVDFDVPLAYLGPEFSGQQVTVGLFDAAESQNNNTYFYFDTIPEPDDWYLSKNETKLNNGWNWYTFTVPSEEDPTNPIPFYGGRLYVRYNPNANDTYGWKMTVQGRPILVE